MCCVEMLVELMWFKFNIVVVGMYGKIMMIIMVVVFLDYGKFDLMVINGGIIYVYGFNVWVGDGEWMVVEVDEFDGIFNCFLVIIVIVINIDLEYMEYWGDFDMLCVGFNEFVLNIFFYGFVVCCIDYNEV